MARLDGSRLDGSRRSALIKGLSLAALASLPRGAHAAENSAEVSKQQSRLPEVYKDLTRLPGFSSGYVPVTGGRLHYVSGGAGEKTIVLLHKLGGWIAEWRWIMPVLAQNTRVIAVDLAGHGASIMDGEPPYIVTQEELAAQLMSLLDTLEIGEVSIAGSSLGGCVGAVCAAFWPDRIASLVTLGSALAGSASRQSLLESDQNFIDNGMFDAQDNPLPRDPSYMQDRFGMTDPVLVEDMSQSRSAAGRWIQPCARGVGIFDYFALAPRVTAPVMMMYGTKGNYGNFIDDAVAAFPNAIGYPVEDAIAFPHQDKPVETAQKILEFLAT